jgi:hypothetical protein
MPRLTIDELTRLAFIYGEQDRMGLADACGFDTRDGKRALSVAKQMRAYRMKRWGKTALEATMGTVKSVSISDIAKGINNK